MSDSDISRQDEVAAFLSHPQSYGHWVSGVTRIDTHAAHVFLAGPFAYKMKRAVKLHYLDFSTLEQRRQACQRELEINQPNAPQIYERLIPLTREQDCTLAFGGDGEIVEWLIRMRRFDQDCLLSNLARKGALDHSILTRLADRVVAAQTAAPRIMDISSADGMQEIVKQLIAAFGAAKEVLTESEIDRFAERSNARLEAADHCLDLRARRGLVRRCHGDLHLANIVLQDGEPVLFDAIEFDEKIATIDLLYDLAFLLMDLLQRGLRTEAHLVLSRYIQLRDSAIDLYGLIALPLFLGCRAGVRAMVAIDRMKNAQGDAAVDAAREDARAYFAAALSYLAPPPPVLIAVGGLSGTGKTSVARMLAPSIDPPPGAIHLRSDVERKKMFGMPETEPLPPQRYSSDVTARVYDRLLLKAKVALRAGHAVIVDAVFASAEERAAIERVAERHQVRFIGLWLSASGSIMKARVADRTGDASDATPEIVDQQLTYSTGPIGWRPVDASGALEDTVALAANLLTEQIQD